MANSEAFSLFFLIFGDELMEDSHNLIRWGLGRDANDYLIRYIIGLRVKLFLNLLCPRCYSGCNLLGNGTVVIHGEKGWDKVSHFIPVEGGRSLHTHLFGSFIKNLLFATLFQNGKLCVYSKTLVAAS